MDVKQAQSKEGTTDLYLVLKFMDTNLKKYIRGSRHTGGRIQPDIIKNLMFQLCKGVAFCHGHGVIHRSTTEALFRGDSELQQLLHIFRLLGTPNEEVWPGVTSLRDWHVYPQCRPRSSLQLSQCCLLLSQLPSEVHPFEAASATTTTGMIVEHNKNEHEGYGNKDSVNKQYKSSNCANQGMVCRLVWLFDGEQCLGMPASKISADIF
ncbi:hypothetical protein Droror1_Dr00014526 [Drosera rotundifolia]